MSEVGRYKVTLFRITYEEDIEKEIHYFNRLSDAINYAIEHIYHTFGYYIYDCFTKTCIASKYDTDLLND